METEGRTPGIPPRTPREEGVVLILILVLIVFTITTVYSFQRTSVLEALSLKQHDTRVRAELLARSGIEIGVRAVEDDRFEASDLLSVALETAHDPWRLLSDQAIELPDGAGSLTITVEDSGGRINLNGLVDEDGELREDSRPFLKAALERIIEQMPGRDEEKPYEVEDLADALLDWLDSDDQTRMGENEDAFYERQGGKTPALNRPILSLDELSEIPGLDRLLLESMKSYFTAYPMFPDIEKSGINPNTAPPYALALVYHGTSEEKHLLNRDEVFRILQSREEGKTFCASEYGEDCTNFEELTGFAGETFFPPIQTQSNVFRIRSVARIGQARACVLRVIDRQGETPQILVDRTNC